MIKEQFEILKKSDADGHINQLRDHYITIDRANQLFYERGVKGHTSIMEDKILCDTITTERRKTDNCEVLMFFKQDEDIDRLNDSVEKLSKENIKLREIIKKLEEKSGE